MLPTIKKKTAASLVEVLVVLAIIAVSMVFVAEMNVRALLIIRDNEIADTANGLLIKVLELAKSPTDVPAVDINGSPVSVFEGLYSVDNVATVNSEAAVLIKQAVTGEGITTCTPDSAYWVDLSDYAAEVPSGEICMQVMVSEVAREISEQTVFLLEVKTVYNLSDGTYSNSLTGYRRGEFSS